MARVTSYRHGVPSWNDVSSPDIERTAAFYCGLFGWEVTSDQGEEFGGYRIFSMDGDPVAGIGPANAGPPAWTTYIHVADADAAATRISAAGGSVAVPPMDLPGGNGRIAFGIDPSGGFFGVAQAGPNHFGAAVVNETGTVVWHELNARDLSAVLPFYESVFGWTSAPMDDTPAGYQVISLDGRAIAGAMTIGEEFPAEVPTNWLPYFVVVNAQAASDSAIELGGGVQVPPFDTPMGPMAVLADPTGAVFAVAAMAQVDDPNDWPT